MNADRRTSALAHVLRWSAVAALVAASAACTERPAVSCTVEPGGPPAQQFADRSAIERVLSRANIGFELSDPDMFANAFAEDAVYELVSDNPAFGYQKLAYTRRADIRTIISDRVERARTADPATLSYDPASLRRYNRNNDELIEFTGDSTARHISTRLVVMKTNVDIHMSAVGRYEDELVKRNGEWLIAKRRRIE